MSLFPAFLKLEGRRVIVIGGGALASSKIPGLLQANAVVRVIAPAINDEVLGWTRLQKIEWHKKLFSAEDLEGACLAIAATSLRDVNAAVYQEADRRGILCNSVDDIENCHFYYGAIVQRGDLQIAISTNGKSPALAQRLRKEFERSIRAGICGLARMAGCCERGSSGAIRRPEPHQALATRDGQSPDV